ncbi:hypothetical protein AAK967_07310 [Atopobiaceae bacterium 24-176]
MADKDIEKLVEDLSAPGRRTRQDAAHEVAALAAENPAAVVPFVADLCDALERPEAQTRWEVLSALTSVAAQDSAACEAAVEAAEASLFDEDSSMVRLAAFRLIVQDGLAGAEEAERVWPILDEAVQCFHGDPEYRGMLVSLVAFAQGPAPASVREALAERVAFDAEKSTLPYIKSYSQEIVEAAKSER